MSRRYRTRAWRTMTADLERRKALAARRQEAEEAEEAAKAAEQVEVSE